MERHLAARLHHARGKVLPCSGNAEEQCFQRKRQGGQHHAPYPDQGTAPKVAQRPPQLAASFVTGPCRCPIGPTRFTNGISRKVTHHAACGWPICRALQSLPHFMKPCESQGGDYRPTAHAQGNGQNYCRHGYVSGHGWLDGRNRHRCSFHSNEVGPPRRHPDVAGIFLGGDAKRPVIRSGPNQRCCFGPLELDEIAAAARGLPGLAFSTLGLFSRFWIPARSTASVSKARVNALMCPDQDSTGISYCPPWFPTKFRWAHLATPPTLSSLLYLRLGTNAPIPE